MKKYYKISVILIVYILIFGFMFSFVLLKDKDISKIERRKLAKLPKFSVEKVFDKRYFKELESYFLDQFPARNEFRKIKAAFNLNILKKKDDDGLVKINNKIFKIDKTLKEGQVNIAIKKFNYIMDTHPEARQYYYALIPDKTYFLSDYPKMDYDRLEEQLLGGLERAKYIDLKSLLELDDYYDSDPHWKQEEIDKVAKQISRSTVGEYYPLKNTSVKELDNFYGAYASQLAIKTNPDKIVCISGEDFNGIKIKTIDDKKIDIYNYEYFKNVDPYDVYLGGAVPLVSIENKNAMTDKHIIIFRDSFASSLAPLMLDTYSKVTLVDIRYMSSKLVGEYVDFEGAYVVFMYSTTVINSGGILK